MSFKTLFATEGCLKSSCSWMVMLKGQGYGGEGERSVGNQKTLLCKIPPPQKTLLCPSLGLGALPVTPQPHCMAKLQSSPANPHLVWGGLASSLLGQGLGWALNRKLR